jgi:hypothetical protein
MNESILLFSTAAMVGLLHTAAGPDHYLPFVALSRAKNWTIRKTILIVSLCGFGHVAGSIILGLLGISLGAGLQKMLDIESSRGDIAAWILFGFGIMYMLYGLWRAQRHSHHHHIDEKKNVTAWVLFIIFVFGPCESLIPLMLYPAAQQSSALLIGVLIVFSLVTIGSMLGITLLILKGLTVFKSAMLHRYSHALAGLTITLCGVLVLFLGL